jgi:hypothetical protein
MLSQAKMSEKARGGEREREEKKREGEGEGEGDGQRKRETDRERETERERETRAHTPHIPARPITRRHTTPSPANASSSQAQRGYRDHSRLS